MSCSQKDRFVLQELARQYMEAASLPVQQERRMLWSCLKDVYKRQTFGYGIYDVVLYF